MRNRFAILALLLLILLPRVSEKSATAGQEALAFSNQDQIVSSLRHGLRNQARTITVRFSSQRDLLENLTEMAGEWMEAALSETEDGAEGDYLRYQYGGYRLTCNRAYRDADKMFDYTIQIVPDYYLYHSQEEAVTQKLAELFDSFSFSAGTADEVKIRTIYDYLCAHVTYDQVHGKNARYHLKSTAYAALIQGTATCQGYCVTLYRMLRMAGVPCRIMTGMAGQAGESHAWVICACNGKWYYLDPTWDAGQTAYSYFLRGANAFADHTPGAAFSDPSFQSRYPIETEDYPCF